MAVAQQYGMLSRYLQRVADGLPVQLSPGQIRYRVAVSVRSREKERTDGDRCAAFPGVGPRFYILLCDGMGTGAPAAVQACRAAHRPPAANSGKASRIAGPPPCGIPPDACAGPPAAAAAPVPGQPPAGPCRCGGRRRRADLKRCCRPWPAFAGRHPVWNSRRRRRPSAVPPGPAWRRKIRESPTGAATSSPAPGLPAPALPERRRSPESPGAAADPKEVLPPAARRCSPPARPRCSSFCPGPCPECTRR